MILIARMVNKKPVVNSQQSDEEVLGSFTNIATCVATYVCIYTYVYVYACA